MIEENSKSWNGAEEAARLAAAFKGAMRLLASEVAIITTSHEGADTV